MAVLKKKSSTVQKIVKKVATGKPVARTTAASKDYIYSVGRRKTAVARIRLFVGSGDNIVNSKSIKTFFPGEVLQEIIFRPFETVGKREGLHFTVKVLGGGVNSQAEAVSHGLARALVKADEEHKKALRDAGLLTRDPRMRETRKMGTGGKARRAKQSPKR